VEINSINHKLMQQHIKILKLIKSFENQFPQILLREVYTFKIDFHLKKYHFFLEENLKLNSIFI